METLLKLNYAEVLARVPYRELAESVNLIHTGRARRLMDSLGLDMEKVELYLEMATEWHLVTGFPDDKAFSQQELDDWDLISLFISKL